MTKQDISVMIYIFGFLAKYLHLVRILNSQHS